MEESRVVGLKGKVLQENKSDSKALKPKGEIAFKSHITMSPGGAKRHTSTQAHHHKNLRENSTLKYNKQDSTLTSSHSQPRLTH